MAKTDLQLIEELLEIIWQLMRGHLETVWRTDTLQTWEVTLVVGQISAGMTVERGQIKQCIAIAKQVLRRSHSTPRSTD